MAILCRAIMANIDKMVIMAILVWIDMAINKYLCLCEEQKNVDILVGSGLLPKRP